MPTKRYSHISFTRPLTRECSKLSYLQFSKKEIIKTHSEELLLKMNVNDYKWYSLYTHEKQSNEYQTTFNWVGEYELRNIKSKKNNYLFMENDHEVTWAKIEYRKSLFRREIIDSTKTKINQKFKAIKNLPRYIHVLTIYSKKKLS